MKWYWRIFYIVIVTLLIACPIGIGGAIYLNEYIKVVEGDIHIAAM